MTHWYTQRIFLTYLTRRQYVVNNQLSKLWHSIHVFGWAKNGKERLDIEKFLKEIHSMELNTKRIYWSQTTP
jgi:hypothetical protein